MANAPSSIGMVKADSQTGSIKFGSAPGSLTVSSASASGKDDLGNTWTVTTVGTTSFTQNSSYSQIGKAKAPAKSITLSASLPSASRVTSFSIKMGGFSSTAGDIKLSVDGNEVGSGKLNATNDVTVSMSVAGAEGKELKIEVTNIAKGTKLYSVSYTLEESQTSDPAISVVAAAGMKSKEKINVPFTFKNFEASSFAVESSNEDLVTAQLADDGKSVDLLSALATSAENNTATITIKGFTGDSPAEPVATAAFTVTVAVPELNTTPAKYTNLGLNGQTSTLSSELIGYGAAVTYSYTISDPAIATITDFDSAKGSGTITSGTSEGTATITVTAKDGTNVVASHSFEAKTNKSTLQVDAPSAKISFATGSKQFTLTPKYFGSGLEYSVAYSNQGIVEASAAGEALTITPIKVGATKVTVTGTDSLGNSASADIDVEVVTEIIGSMTLTYANFLGTGDSRTKADDYVTVTQEKNGGIDIVEDDKYIKLYASHKLTIHPNGSRITSISMSCSGDNYTPGTDQTWTNADVTVNGTNVTITPVDPAADIVLVVSKQIRANEIAINYAYEAPASDVWAISFLGNSTAACEANKNAASMSQDLIDQWAAAKADFEALEADQKALIKNAIANVAGTQLQQAVARYDLIVKKYGAENFAGRAISTPEANVINGTTDDLSASVAIAALGLTGAVAIGSYFFLRKKKQF